MPRSLNRGILGDKEDMWYGSGKDVAARWDGSNLIFTPVATNTVAYFGTSTLGLDLHLRSALGTRKIGGLVHCPAAASSAHTSTTTEAAFSTGSYTLPANSVTAGTLIRVRAAGIATATANSDTLTITMKVGGTGGTTVATSGAVDAANDDVFHMDVSIVIRTIGASGTFVAAGVTGVVGAVGTATNRNTLTNSTTINTTTTNDIVVSADWSTTDVNNSCRLDLMTVEIIRG